MQGVPNPSGSVGEPKFNVGGLVSISWALLIYIRLMRLLSPDPGVVLSVTVRPSAPPHLSPLLVHLTDTWFHVFIRHPQANYLISHGETDYPTNTIWPAVQTDLDYVASDWNQVCVHGEALIYGSLVLTV